MCDEIANFLMVHRFAVLMVVSSHTTDKAVSKFHYLANSMKEKEQQHNQKTDENHHLV